MGRSNQPPPSRGGPEAGADGNKSDTLNLRGDTNRATSGSAASPSAPKSNPKPAGASEGQVAVAVEEAATLPSEKRAGEAAPLAIFQPGHVVARRYKIMRVLAHGGMGEVYEAEDLELREQVALKTILPEIAASKRAIERFKREIHLARKVTHPNVCRLFDVGHHRVTGAQSSLVPGAIVTFLTMELLRGETLAQRVRRTGPLSTEEALPLVRQMAAGLQAAHAAGIVHRDFKSENVVLVADEAGGGTGLRVVITDFGVARGNATEDRFASSVSRVGDIVGSPAYMAPEQVEGAPVTAAADLYALGVVMYEIVTGNLPFQGGTSFATAAKRLTEAPRPPREHVAGLDPRWELAILRCLEREPARRFPTAADVVAALVDGDVAAARHSLAIGRVRRHRVPLFGILALLAALGLVGGVYRLGHRRARAVAAAEAAARRRSVAVLGFRNLSARPESAWLSNAFSELLSTELGAGGKIRSIAEENVARMKIELGLQDAESLAAGTLARIRANLGTDYVVVGSYLALGDKGGGKIRLDLRLQDAASGENVGVLSETGTEAELLELVSRSGARLRERLGVGPLSAADEGAARAALPKNPEVARLYTEGLARLSHADGLAARDLLQKAVLADPDFPHGHRALAAAWLQLGYDAKARQEARTAFDRSQNLSRQERLWIEGMFRETAKEWDKAIEIYRALWTVFPDNLDYGLRLAATQTSAARPKDALATVQALRQLGPPASDDPRVDLQEASAAEGMADYPRELDMAHRAVRGGTALGARVLVANGRLREGWAYLGLGEPRKADEAFEDARRLFAEAGNRQGVAGAINSAALSLWSRGDLEGAMKLHREALASWREIGNQHGIATALNNLGNEISDRGDQAGARKLYEEALEIWRQIGDKSGIALEVGNLADVYRTEGDFAKAQRMAEEALGIWREIGDKDNSGMATATRGRALYDRGDLAGARRSHEQAAALLREVGDKSDLSQSLSDLAQVLLAQGDLPGARKRTEEALALGQQLGEEGTVALDRLQLANILLEEGRLGEAQAMAERAAQEFAKEGTVDEEALAHGLIARVRLARGQVAQARLEIAAPAARANRSQDHEVRLGIPIIEARVRAAEGGRGPAAALHSLRGLLVQAGRAGQVPAALEARLALAEIELASGRAVGRQHLLGLQRDAAQRGFGLIARRAAAATHR